MESIFDGESSAIVTAIKLLTRENVAESQESLEDAVKGQKRLEEAVESQKRLENSVRSLKDAVEAKQVFDRECQTFLI